MVLSKKATSVFAFIEGIHLPHGQVLVLEDRAFYYKVLSKLYLNTNGKSNV